MLRVSKYFGKQPTQRVTSRRASRRFSLGFDRLEDRSVPTVFPGLQHVNSTALSSQHDSVSASSINGSRVVVWVHDIDNATSDLRAQLFNSAGVKVGGNFILAGSLRSNAKPAVCMDNFGRFYVSYTRQTTPSNSDLLVRRFQANGVYLGTSLVAVTVRNEYDSSIACDGAGNFAVSYTVDTTPSNQDIHARRFSPSGILAAFYSISPTASNDETDSDVAVSKTSLSVIHVVFSINSKDIAYHRVGVSGLPLGTWPIDITPLTATNASIDVDFANNAVIAYPQFDGSDWNILARRLTASGVLSTPFFVQSANTQDIDPTVAIDYSEGDFVVAYTSVQSGLIRVMATEMSVPGVAPLHSVVFASTNTMVSRPSVSMNGLDRFIVSFAVLNFPNDPGLGILARFGVR